MVKFGPPVFIYSLSSFGRWTLSRLFKGSFRGGSVRPNPEGQIYKNQMAKNKKPEGRTGRPNLTIRLKNELVWFLPIISKL